MRSTVSVREGLAEWTMGGKDACCERRQAPLDHVEQSLFPVEADNVGINDVTWEILNIS